MAPKKKPYVYIEPKLIPDMDNGELITRLKWLIESQVARYCNQQQFVEDARQIACMVILRDKPKFDPSYNVNFEGWVRIRIAIAIHQMNIDANTPVHVPEKAFRDGIANFPRYIQPINDDEGGGWDITHESVDHCFIDTSVENNDTEATVLSLYQEVMHRIELLPSKDNEIVCKFLKTPPQYRKSECYKRARQLLPSICSGLEEAASEIFN